MINNHHIMPSKCGEKTKPCEGTQNNIPSQFLNEFGFINYKADGSVPWATTDNVSLFKEYKSITDILGIDCEMVKVGGLKRMVLGRVSIVNEYGFCVYDTFVNPMEEITDYCTQYSGIRAENLVGAPPIDFVVKKVATIVEGRILVGHSIHHDLDVLTLDHPSVDIRDTASFFQCRNGTVNPSSLKNLIKQNFDIKIQDGEHSSIQDAQATLRLYLYFREEWEKNTLERRRNAKLDDIMIDKMCEEFPWMSDLLTQYKSTSIQPL